MRFVSKKFLVVLLALLVFSVIAPVAAGATWYVDDDGGSDFTSIQAAVNAANTGDTIIVRDGTYIENVDVNVSNIKIQSENGFASTTVSASYYNDHVFDVTEDYVNISGFTVECATTGSSRAGIYLNGSNNCNISDNNVTNNYYGIYLESSSNNTLTDNTASDNVFGIYLGSSSNNTLTDNTASDNDRGIHLRSSSDNTLKGNTASNNYFGIYLSSSSHNTLTNNTAN